MIRDATEQDLPAIRDIYNDAVLNTTAIWNEQLVDLANRQAWFTARQAQRYPILVAVDNDEVTGLRLVRRLAPLRRLSLQRRALGLRAQRPARQRPRPAPDANPDRTRARRR
jgi:hypothetical protein